MTAWEILTANSTISTGTAWQHLNAQGGGAGGDVYVYGEIIAAMEGEIVAVWENEIIATVEQDIVAIVEPERIAQIKSELHVEVCK